MIPSQNIVAWGSVVPWADQRQVEQDLIISRALIDIFNVSRAQAEERMFAKLANPRLLIDMKSLLPLAQAESLTAEATRDAFTRVFEGMIDKIAGDPWVRTGEMKERFGLDSAGV
jgi:hypothetical protein